MRNWTVVGSDRDSGEDRVLAVVALTEEEARAEAAAKGLVVESARESTITAAEPARLSRASIAIPTCSVCGARIAPVKRAKGSRVVLIILLLMGGLPGVLYLVFFSGYNLVCPACGAIRAKLA
jgi:hypothetical protein